MSFDWKSLLGNIAPVIGTAIGGPFGALAGSAVKLALGLPEDSDEQAMAKAMEKATPEQLLALQNAERQFKLDMEKLNVDVIKIDADDRNSARNREMTLKDKAPVRMATFVTIGFFGILGYMCGFDIPEKNTQMINIMLGALGTSWAGVINYYFGSSSSSRNKDMLLYNSTPTKNV